LEDGVNHVFVDVNLLTEGVVLSWWEGGDVGGGGLDLVSNNHTVEEESDEVGVDTGNWGMGHGHVDVGTHDWEHESHWSFSGNGGVQGLNLGIDEFAELWHHVVDGHIDELSADINKLLKERVLHLDADVIKVELGGVNEFPVDVVGGWDLFELEFDGHVGDIDGGGVHWDEMESTERSVKKNRGIDAGEHNLYLVGSWNHEELLGLEAGDGVDVDGVKGKFVKDGGLGDVGHESMVVEHVITQDWHESLHHVVDGGGVDVSTQGTGVQLSLLNRSEIGKFNCRSNGSQGQEF